MEPDQRPAGVTAFFGLLAERFVDGRLDEMALCWSYPCPLEVDGDLRVLKGPGDLAAFLSGQRDAAMAAGLTGVTPRIRAIEMPRKGRFRVWVHWLRRYGDREAEDDQGMVYFLATRPDGALTIEMMDSVPLAPERTDAARSA